MNSKNSICFQKINGKKPTGKQLEILVDGSIVEKPFIQPNIKNTIAKANEFVRIINSNLFKENIALPLKDPENYTDIIEQIERTAKNYYCSNGIRRIFSNNSEIEIRVQKSYSLT